MQETANPLKLRWPPRERETFSPLTQRWPLVFDRFAPALVEQYLGRYAKEKLGISLHDLLAMAG